MNINFQSRFSAQWLCLVCNCTDGKDDILHTGIGSAVVRRCPQLLPSLDYNTEQ